MQTMCRVVLAAAVALASGGAARAAVTAVPGFAVHGIPTPDTVQGGVVRRGGALFVGQGATFTANAQYVVRLDGGGATTIATGFNALGGFDLADDGTLYVVDNAFELAGTTSGDTVYAIPDALVRTTALAAPDAEVLPAGAIPAAQDVRVAPDGALLVTDAAGPGAGRVLRIAATTIDLVTGLDFLGGIALADDGSLVIANLDAGFAGNVLHYAGAGGFIESLAGGLSGAFDVVLEDDGTPLVSGGFLPDFSSSTVVAVGAGGTVTERARGFAFSTEMFFDRARDEVLVNDFDATEVVAICRDRDDDTVCDADDGCPLASDPGQEDADGDGTGDACDPCTGERFVEAKLRLGKLANDLGDDVLAFAGWVPLPDGLTLAPDVTGVGVLLNQGALLDATVPGGAFDPVTRTGWKRKRGTWTFRGEKPGVHKVVLRTSGKRPGEVKVVLRAEGGRLPIGPTDLPLVLTVVLGPETGECGDALLPADGCKLNDRKGKVLCR
jgi:hypothetical protein